MTQSGKIQAISGLVTARTPEGQVRELQLGDFVYENEIIETSAGASLSIIQEDGNVIALKSNDQIFFDESVTGSINPSDAVIQEVAELQEAIVQALENNTDIDELLDDTAAGGLIDSYDHRTGFHAGDTTKGDVSTYLLDPENTRTEQVDELFGDNNEEAVTQLNAPSVLAPDTNTATEDQPLSGNVLDNDSDVDNALTVATFSIEGDTAVYTAGQTATITDVGTLEILATGEYTFTPESNWNGDIPQVTYETNTGSSTTLDINVAPVDDASTLSLDTDVVQEDTQAKGNVLENDSDVDNALTVATFSIEGDTAVYTAGQTATITDVGTLEILATGVYTFTPESNWNGDIPQVTYETNTGSSTTLDINVAPVDDASTLSLDTDVVQEDTQAKGNVLENDSDVDNALTVATFSIEGDTAVYTAGQTATITDVGTLEILATGEYTFTPESNWNGDIPQVTYETNTGSSTTLDINVAPVDDASTLSLDTDVVQEDTQAKGNVLENDSDVDNALTVATFSIEGDTAVYTAGQTATITDVGTLEILATGEYTFTPESNWNGDIPQVTYETNTGSSTTLDINVTPVDDASTLSLDTDVVQEDTQAKGNVLENDSDVDNALTVATFSIEGDTAVYTAGQTATITDVGTLEILATGVYTFTPESNWNGDIPQVTYETNTGSSTTLDINVAPVDDASTLSLDTDVVQEDTQAKGNVLENDSDVDNALTVATFSIEGDTAVYTAGQTATITDVGTLEILATGEYTFTPESNWNGDIPQVTYETNTGSSTTLDINVTPVNDAPIANNFEIELNALNEPLPINFDPQSDSSRISDEEDDAFADDAKELNTVVITSLPVAGILSYQEADGSIREIEISDLNTTEFDYEKITYQSDSGSNSALGTVFLGTKDVPDDSSDLDGDGFYNWGEATSESTVREFTMDNGNVVTISSSSGPLTQNNNEANHIGYGISDNDGQGIQKGESIDIDFGDQTMSSLELGLDGLGGLFESGDNNAVKITISYLDPTTGDLSTVVENYQKPAGVRGNDGLFQVVTIGDGDGYDINSDGKLISDISFSTTTAGNWELRYLEGQGSSQDYFTYKVIDSDGLESSEGQVTINYDIPVAYSDTVSTDEDSSLSLTVPEASHPQDDVAAGGYSLVKGVGESNGKLTFSSDGSYTFEPGSDFDYLAEGETATVSFTYTAKDSDGSVSSPATVTVTVTGVNDAPITIDDNLSATQNTAMTYAAAELLGNDSDLEGNTLSIASVTSGTGGTAVLNDDGTVTFTPNENFIGDADFSYTATDGDLPSNSATVTVDVGHAPVAIDDSYIQTEVMAGLKGEYFGVNFDDVTDRDNFLIDNIADFRNIISTKTADATFIAKDIYYGSGSGSLSVSKHLNTFLGSDAETLSWVDDSNHDEGGVHLTGSIYLEAGTYRFTVLGDDGYEILIDNKQVAAVDKNQPPTSDGFDSFTVSESGYYPIDVVYWDQGGQYVFQPQLEQNSDGTWGDLSHITASMLQHEVSVVNSELVTTENTDLIIESSYLLSNDEDLDGDAIDIAGITEVTNGSVVYNTETGELTFSPTPGYVGEASFTYEIEDAHGNAGEEYNGDGTTSATVTLNVVSSETSTLSLAETTSSESGVTITGTDADEVLVGDTGSDTINAGGGDDTIIFDAADAHIDGGDGADTLIISNAVLDFSNIANGTIENIEKLALNNDETQAISLTLDDVLDMTGAENVLELTGGVGDKIVIDETGWTQDSTNSGLFTNSSGDTVKIVSSADSGNEIQILFTDDGTEIG